MSRESAYADLPDSFLARQACGLAYPNEDCRVYGRHHKSGESGRLYLIQRNNNDMYEMCEKKEVSQGYRCHE